MNSILKRISRNLRKSLFFGKAFLNTCKFLEESQWWSEEKLEEYQLNELKKLLKHSYVNVPYYRRLFDENSVKPTDIKTLSDLNKIPHLTKDIFRNHFKEITARNRHPFLAHQQHTSGTSGKPLQFYESFSTLQKEYAFIYHQWSRVGYVPGEPLLQLRGKIIIGSKKTEYNPITNVLRFSPDIDSKETVRYYLDKMGRFSANFLHGYPSTIAFFGHMIKKYGFKVPFKLKAVLLASEAIYPWEREITEEVFACRTFGHYGMAEKVALAAECEGSKFYHFIPQYSIVEIDTKTNELVGTSLLNDINPFIRYRTTDVVSLMGDNGCRFCLRHYYPIFSNVEGRLEDIIVTLSGTPISSAVITHPFKDLRTIKNTQIVQRALDDIEINIVPWKNIQRETLENELEKLSKELRNILGKSVKIKYSMVEDIPLSGSGKFQWIISDVSKEVVKNGWSSIS